MEELFRSGDIVLSRAGRDAGRYFVVMRTEDNFCFFADGDLRKIDKMKRKKIKHIKWTRVNSEFVAGKLAMGEKVTNSEIRRTLAEFKEEQEIEADAQCASLHEEA